MCSATPGWQYRTPLGTPPYRTARIAPARAAFANQIQKRFRLIEMKRRSASFFCACGCTGRERGEACVPGCPPALPATARRRGLPAWGIYDGIMTPGSLAPSRLPVFVLRGRGHHQHQRPAGKPRAWASKKTTGGSRGIPLSLNKDIRP